jgi:hypothetical protein
MPRSVYVQLVPACALLYGATDAPLSGCTLMRFRQLACVRFCILWDKGSSWVGAAILGHMCRSRETYAVEGSPLAPVISSFLPLYVGMSARVHTALRERSDVPGDVQ